MGLSELASLRQQLDQVTAERDRLRDHLDRLDNHDQRLDKLELGFARYASRRYLYELQHDFTTLLLIAGGELLDVAKSIYKTHEPFSEDYVLVPASIFPRMGRCWESWRVLIDDYSTNIQPLEGEQS